MREERVHRRGRYRSGRDQHLEREDADGIESLVGQRAAGAQQRVVPTGGLRLDVPGWFGT